ncbi:MAG: ABC transporter permease [Lachnospiraceae bacterium]|nr:ABC transporter permease [Lachnospiraceae bacterium]
MKITARLAWIQIKRDRVRTIGAISAIILSAALTTAVACFVTSAYGSLLDFFGGDFGNYKAMYLMILLVPGLFFGGLIFVMSVTVISNVFLTAANRRLSHFGILKCVGGTPKQIRETIIYESVWLSAVGIPVGLVLGTVLGRIGVLATAKNVDELSEITKTILVRGSIGMDLKFYVYPGIYFVSAALAFLTVLYSAYRPAKKASRVSALTCIRGITSEETDLRVKTKKWIKRIFGFEGVLADRNLSRNKTIFKPTVRALALGVALLLSTGSLVEQCRSIGEIMDPGYNVVEFSYMSASKESVDRNTGRDVFEMVKPIDSETGRKMIDRLKEFGNVKVSGFGYDNTSYFFKKDNEYLSDEMKEAAEYKKASELKVILITLDTENYTRICTAAGVPEGSTLLVNRYWYNRNGRKVTINPFNMCPKELTIEDAGGKETVVKVDGVLPEEVIPYFLDGPNQQEVKLIVPEGAGRFYECLCETEDEDAFMKFAEEVRSELYPDFDENSYDDEGYSVTVSKTETMVRSLNFAIIIAEIVIYGFVAVLLLIGLVSVISTLSTSVIARAGEFAVLKSVGMTDRGLTKMLLTENFMCTLKAGIRGLPFGILLPYLINLAIRQKLPVLYRLPLGILFGSVLGIYAIVMLVTFLTMLRLRKQNIIESIRNKN